MISIVIPTYKNKEQLLNNLQKNLRYFGDNEVIVVNDYPPDDLSAELSEYPHITLIQNNTNLGFGGAVNVGIAQATSEYVVLLNSDVLLLDRTYEDALNHFQEDTNLFAVSFAQIEQDDSIVGKNKIYWHKGLLQHSKAKDLLPGINGWAEGGSCIIDKHKFDTIGGFDKIYAPFYWEDIDLSYRAWKAGYSILFDPKIKVEHHHESTIGKYFQKEKISSIAYRNQFLFIWKNINDFNLKMEHLSYLPFYILYIGYLKKNKELINGFYAALKLRKEIRNTSKIKRGDSDIISLFK